MKKVLTIELIGLINTVEKITKAKVKDAFYDAHKTLIFVVAKGDIRKAVGKQGANVKRLGQMMKKRLKFIEFDEDPAVFIKHCIYPLEVSVNKEEGKVVLEAKDHLTKGKLLGRDKQNLESLKELVSKYFNIEIIVK